MKCSLCTTNPEPAAWTKDDRKFTAGIEKKVQDTIKKYNLFSKNEKITVAVSGGKDSTAILHILCKLGYPVEAITVDAHIGCYTDENLRNLRETCKKLGVKLHEIPFRKAFGASLCYIRDYLKAKGHNFKSCTICGVLRRYLLNRKAREIEAKVIVMGHNLDDEAQSVVMNLLKNRPELNARLGPRIDSVNGGMFVPRAKPFYHIREDEIVRYSKLMQFPVKYERCPCSSEGFRSAVRNFLNDCEKEQPKIKENIVAGFLKQRKKIRKNFSSGKPETCSQCGEFSGGKVCKACNLLGLLRKPLKA